jgi:hypothetical protein
MKSLHETLLRDLNSPASRATLLLEAELDDLTLLLSDAPRHIGTIEVLPAVEKWGAISTHQLKVIVNGEALPNCPLRWLSRTVRVWRVVDGMLGVEDGDLLFEGVFEQEPSQVGSKLTLVLGPRRVTPRTIPNYGVIEAGEWPDAPAEAMGQAKPMIYGTVEECPLLPVAQPPFTTLADEADPGDRVLKVADATAFPASGTVVVDGVSYAYTGKDDGTLTGLSVTRYHRTGTAACLAGQTTYLAAGHAVQSISAVKGDGQVLFGGSLDLTDALVSFTSLPTKDKVEPAKVLEAHFDEVDGTSTAVNGPNAIRAVTGTETQGAASLPTNVTESDNIEFPRPTEQGGSSRIISGVYEVDFAVTETMPPNSRAEVRIGGKIAWVYDSGGVVWTGAPFTFDKDDDVDLLSVDVKLYGAPPGSVTVGVTTATRTIAVGNLDSSAMATLRKSSNTDLVVRQVTDMPPRGRVKKAWLLVEHGTSAATIDTVDVEWGGRKLGELNMENAGGDQTVSKTISVDTVSSMTAALRSNNVSGISSNSAGYLSNTANENVTIQPAYPVYSGTSGWAAPLDSRIPIPAGATSQTLVITVWFGQAGYDVSYTGTCKFRINGQDPTYGVIGFNQAVQFNVSISAGQEYLTVESYEYSYPSYRAANAPQAAWIKYSVQVNPKFSVGGGGFSGSPYVQNKYSDVPSFQPVARVDGSAGSGNLTFSFKSPRTVVNLFPIPLGHDPDWSVFTNKLAALRYGGAGTQDVMVVRLELLIEFEPVVREPVNRLTATVQGLDGNPATVVKDLAERQGYKVDPFNYARARDWYTAMGWVFARRLAEQTSVSKMLDEAAKQAVMYVFEQGDEVRLIRKLDETQDVRGIDLDDLMNPPKIDWSKLEQVVNHATLRYRTINGEFSKVLVRGPTTQDRWAVRSMEEVLEERRAELQGGWLADDATADAMLQDWLQLNAPLKRTFTFSLPYSFDDVERGDLVHYEPLGVMTRAVEVDTDDAGFVTLICEEVPQP